MHHALTQSAPRTSQQEHNRFHDGIDLLVDAALVASHAIRKTNTIAEVHELNVTGRSDWKISRPAALCHVLVDRDACWQEHRRAHLGAFD